MASSRTRSLRSDLIAASPSGDALSLGETYMATESTETPRLVSVMNGSTCAGFLINLGARGIEAFDKDEKPLGVFPDAISAATAVKRSVAPALTPPVEDRGMSPPLEPAQHSPFGGSAAARVLRCPASVGLI